MTYDIQYIPDIPLFDSNSSPTKNSSRGVLLTLAGP